MREIFATFVRTKSLSKTLDKIQTLRWTTKSRTTRKSKRQTGGRFDRPTLMRLLTNAIYVGEVNHNGTIYPGEQEAIVDRKLWDKANQLLNTRKRGHGSRERSPQGALLSGLLFCAVCGDSMVHGYTTKGGRRYRYYQCQKARKKGSQSCPGQMIAVRRIEKAVVEKLRGLSLENGGQELKRGLDRMSDWKLLASGEQREMVAGLVERISYDHRTQQASLGLTGAAGELHVSVRKNSFDRQPYSENAEKPVSTRLGRVMALAIHFSDLLKSGKAQNFPELGRRAGISTVRVSQIMKLRNLAPAIQEQLLFMTEEQGKFTELRLRRVSGEIDWRRQLKAVAESSN